MLPPPVPYDRVIVPVPRRRRQPEPEGHELEVVERKLEPRGAGVVPEDRPQADEPPDLDVLPAEPQLLERQVDLERVRQHLGPLVPHPRARDPEAHHRPVALEPLRERGDPLERHGRPPEPQLLERAVDGEHLAHRRRPLVAHEGVVGQLQQPELVVDVQALRQRAHPLGRQPHRQHPQRLQARVAHQHVGDRRRPLVPHILVAAQVQLLQPLAPPLERVRQRRGPPTCQLRAPDLELGKAAVPPEGDGQLGRTVVADGVIV
mmetsp:Transcript_27220/g.68587  ORF Transcript_27220/g.68587 Transcript_27220/m.68587 type:complete len:262 (-) Transcript_27220:187-972(-)